MSIINLPEVWKAIAGYEGLYEISSHGRVKSLAKPVMRNTRLTVTKEVVRKNHNDHNGYPQAHLSKNLIKRTFKIHRLVAIAFIPNPDSKPQVNHIDGDKQNSHYTNLEWCTASENINHAYKMGLMVPPSGGDRQGETLHNAKLTNDNARFIRASNLNKWELAKMFNVTERLIRDVRGFRTYNKI